MQLAVRKVTIESLLSVNTAGGFSNEITPASTERIRGYCLARTHRPAMSLRIGGRLPVGARGINIRSSAGSWLVWRPPRLALTRAKRPFARKRMTDVAQSPTMTRPPGQVPSFGGITRVAPEPRRNDKPDFVAIHNSAEFTELRRRFRRFVFPMSAAFFLWYLTYVLLAAYARDLMSQKIMGSINVGLVLGLLQFVSTIAITAAYLWYARKNLDPRVKAIRTAAGVAPK